MASAQSADMVHVEGITQRITTLVQEVQDPIWQLELAGYAYVGDVTHTARTGRLHNACLQIIASGAALLMHVLLLLRYRGSSPGELRDAGVIAAIHAEDSTRTRHLRQTLESYLQQQGSAMPTVLLLGRPRAAFGNAYAALHQHGHVARLTALRPLSPGSFVRGLRQALRGLAAGIAATHAYRGQLPFSERIAMAYRVVQGATHAAWWRKATKASSTCIAVFGHTGTADTSALERAMQADGVKTVHLVHGTNIGWPNGGISDLALFLSGADARLGESLPAYARCAHLPMARPAVQAGNGKWAVLTSYTHRQQLSYRAQGSAPDCKVVAMVRSLADELGQPPEDVLWRPHPQIEHVDADQRMALLEAVAKAGFTRWPQTLPYQALADFSLVVTTPSTALTDALQLGQPAIIASPAPLQRDLFYARYPLLATDRASLAELARRVLDPHQRAAAFAEGWRAVEPAAAPDWQAIVAEGSALRHQ